MLTVHPRPERQAIFLGATEPTRCPTGKEPAAGGHVSKPRRAYGVNQQSGEPRLHVLASSGRMASLRRGFSLRVPLAAFGPAMASHVGFRLSAEHMRPSSRLMSMGRRFAFNKTVEEYRRLAKECRETARTVSRERPRDSMPWRSRSLATAGSRFCDGPPPKPSCRLASRWSAIAPAMLSLVPTTSCG